MFLTVKHNFAPDLGVRPGPGEHALYLGWLSENKGVGLLIEAWERLTASRRVDVVPVVRDQDAQAPFGHPRMSPRGRRCSHRCQPNRDAPGQPWTGRGGACM